jgi:hypothetical protein
VSAPPDHVRAAAAVVDHWVREQETRQLTADEIAKLSPAKRLDYARRFDQKTMPAWENPQKG